MPPKIHLPLVYVDDEATELIRVRQLERLLGVHVEQFTSLAAAERGLLATDDPFLLIIDQDFSASRAVDGSRRGSDLVRTLRTQHAWGRHLPVLLLSQRIDDADHSELTRELGWKGATAFVPKQLADAERIDHLPDYAKDLELDTSLDGFRLLAATIVRLDQQFREDVSDAAAQEMRRAMSALAPEDDDFDDLAGDDLVEVEGE